MELSLIQNVTIIAIISTICTFKPLLPYLSLPITKIRHPIITYIRRNMFSQNSSREVRSFCEWKRSLVSGIIARGSDTFWETAVNIVPMQRAVLAIAMCALESDVTWRGWFRFEKHQFQTEHEFWFELWNESIRCHALICDQPRIMLNHDVFVSCLEKKSCVPACKCKELNRSLIWNQSIPCHALICDQPRIMLTHDDFVSCLENKSCVPACRCMVFQIRILILISCFEFWGGGKYLKWTLRMGPATPVKRQFHYGSSPQCEISDGSA